MRFVLIDRITLWEVGSAAEATKNVALSEDFFDEHFPRRPVMPGVLIVEGMTQLARLLLEETLCEKQQRSAKAVLTCLERTRFRDMIRPGDALRYRVEITDLAADGGKISAKAYRGEKMAVAGGMTFAFADVEDPQAAVRRSALLKTLLCLESPR